MKTQLTHEELAALLPHIHDVIKTGEPWEDESMHHPVEAIVSAVLSIEGMERREVADPRYGLVGFETNGWQWDWWQDFQCGGVAYTLSGSGYYGGQSFHRSDEQ
jgi:hypothetical protein